VTADPALDRRHPAKLPGVQWPAC